MMVKTIIQPGMVVNGYKIESVLGEGGMATVFKATQTSLNRPVALKVLHQKYSQRPDFLARFERESDSLAKVQHPNIVSVIDRGEYVENYYFVMEFVEGSDLDDLLAEYEFDIRQAIQIINEVGKAMACVHHLDMVHRDMKPANILIGTSGAVKVSDFGIASIARGARDTDQKLTGEGAAMGTGVYIAPEQMADAANVDHRADIYALGATFYKLLTRKLPAGHFPRPSQINAKVPPAVDDVILQALDPDPARRPQEVREFCRKLILALKNQSVESPSAPLVETHPSSIALGRLQQSETVRGRAPQRAAGRGKGKPARKGKKGKKTGQTSPFPAKAVWIAAAVAAVLTIGTVAAVLMTQGGPEDEQASVTDIGSQIALLQRAREASPTPATAVPANGGATVQGPGSPQNPPAAVPTVAATPEPVPTLTPTPVPTPTPTPAPTPIPTPPPHLLGTERMVIVRGHVAALGSPDDPLASPPQRTFIGSFFIDRYEVSSGEYASFVRLMNARPPDNWGGTEPPADALDLPVHGISLEEATAYAAWIGKRLPTESEWESAVRLRDPSTSPASPGNLYPWAGRFEDGSPNYATGQLRPVNEAPGDMTPAGIHHAGGNVAEWTISPFLLYEGSRLEHPDAGGQYYVIRGGSALDFSLQSVAPEEAVAVSHRSYAHPQARIPGVGFRCVTDVGGAAR